MAKKTYKGMNDVPIGTEMRHRDKRGKLIEITQFPTMFRVQFEDRDEVDACLNTLDKNQITLINHFTNLFENRPEDPIRSVNSAIERATLEPE